MFTGKEVFCKVCGKYAIVEDGKELDNCLYCDANKNFLRITDVNYEYTCEGRVINE
ncbi:MAG: hypothetical protein ACOC2W_00590 [bacterium]